MNVSEFVSAVEDQGEGLRSDALVAVQVDGHPPFIVKGVRLEVHEDADGSATLWIEAEES